jgi:hypothetical protein
MKGAKELGHNDFAYGLHDLLTWMVYAFYEVLASTGVFLVLYSINVVLDKIMGTAMADQHFVGDAMWASLIAQALIVAMIIEGIRIRRRYYEFIVPLRRIYRHPRLKKDLLQPSFVELYRLW